MTSFRRTSIRCALTVTLAKYDVPMQKPTLCRANPSAAEATVDFFEAAQVCLRPCSSVARLIPPGSCFTGSCWKFMRFEAI